MSDAPASMNQKIVTDVKVTAHLMTLETGLFCILQRQASAAAEAAGLPGVRVSVLPGVAEDDVAITSFRPDGWLGGHYDAALVRVFEGPAQLLVTVYQSIDGRGGAPNVQVLRLAEAEGVAPVAPLPGPQPGQMQGAGPAAQPAGRPAPQQPPGMLQAGAARPGAPYPVAADPQRGFRPEISAHVQRRGDVVAQLGDWIGDRGSQRWIEGFAIAPASGVAPSDIEYQAVLGRGWLSPWVEGGQFCGSRGMALPILGLRVRLRGAAADAHECSLSASFVDGSAVGPVSDGEPCESQSLAPLEAFQLTLRPRFGAAAQPHEPDVREPALAEVGTARVRAPRKESAATKRRR